MKRIGTVLIALVLVILAALILWVYTRDERAGEFEEAREVTEEARGVVLVPVEYKDGRWSVGEGVVEVLPCEPPTYFLSGTESEPLVQVLGTDGKVVYQRNLEMDPRIILHEGPSDEPYLLEEVSFVLRLPLLEDTQSMEFFVEPKPGEEGFQQAPDLRVDLSQAVETYKAMGAMEQAAPCQEPEYKPDQLEK